MYNVKLETRIEAVIKRWQNMEKKKMFGGICWLLKGNMAFGIWKDFLIVRMDRDQAVQSLEDRIARPFDITGRVMAGWVMVAESGWKSRTGLAKWLVIAKKFSLSLPEKKSSPGKKKTLRAYKL